MADRTRVGQRTRLRRSCAGPCSRPSGVHPQVPGRQQDGASPRPPDGSARPSAEGRRGHRRTRDPSYRGEAVHRQADRVGTTFADQAVIAIENVRLFDEVEARTRELSESLEQQTATSEVLKVISSSPGELEPVFKTMLENATRVCASKFGTMYLREADAFRTVAMYGAPPAYVEARMREPVFHPGAGTGLGRAAQTKQVVHITDVTADRAYNARDPLRVSPVEQGG